MSIERLRDLLAGGTRYLFVAPQGGALLLDQARLLRFVRRAGVVMDLHAALSVFSQEFPDPERRYTIEELCEVAGRTWAVVRAWLAEGVLPSGVTVTARRLPTAGQPPREYGVDVAWIAAVLGGLHRAGVVKKAVLRQVGQLLAKPVTSAN